jgi:hypothetical protein
MKAERPLFGTLIASGPHARSPAALTLSVLLHVLVLGLLVVLSHKFVPLIKDKLFEDVTIVIPKEESEIIALGGSDAVGKPIKPARSAPARKRAEVVTITPGPIAPIAPAEAGPETPESNVGDPVSGNAGRSLSERLLPQTVDPRLNPRASYTPIDASPIATLRARIAEALGEFNDSVAAETEAKRKALDWTIKGKDGKAWGIDEKGRLVLGGMTFPVPLAFTPAPGKRDEINERNRAYAEIEAQYNREIGRQSFKDRVKAIRARKDLERAEKKKATESAPITKN